MLCVGNHTGHFWMTEKLVKSVMIAYNKKTERRHIMQSTALRINQLLENLEEDYDKAVSYIEFLVNARKKEKTKRGK